MQSDTTQETDLQNEHAQAKRGLLSGPRIAGLIALVLLGILAAVLMNVMNHKNVSADQQSKLDATGAAGPAQGAADGMTRITPKRPDFVPVVTDVAMLKTLPLEIHNIGNVEAYSVVNVIAQVGGQLSKVAINQGQDVKVGQLMFQIDPRSYQAQLDQAVANVSRDSSQISSAQANLQKDMAMQKQAEAILQKDTASQQYADVEVERYRRLVDDGAVSVEQADQIKTNSDTAGATVASDKASVDNAKAVVASDLAAVKTARATKAADQAAADNLRVQLGYTQIRSPINGRTGALNVYQGNVVRANDTTPLITINQVQPIFVTFSIPEVHLEEVRQAQKSGDLKVAARVGGDKKAVEQGQLTFIDNTVDRTTGTLRLKATFPNLNQYLWPGQFVDVVLNLPGAKPSVVVPSRAVQADQNGSSVYVVKPDQTVSFQPVQVDRTYGEYTLIKKGVNVGDTVVVDGQLRLGPGSKVKPTPVKADATSS
jgi:multidrug efflux system membrane fusion protein